jgi:hypothetical protein
MFVGLLAGAAPRVNTAAEDKKDDGFTNLFDGKDLKGWKFYTADKGADPAKTWSVKDGVIECTGKPNGYFYTDKSFKNYVLRYDWKYTRAGEGEKSTYNSGALIHIQEHKIWPTCVEAQGANANHGFLYFLGCKKVESKYDQKARDKAIKPIGEWNTTEITCKGDGSILVKINGTQVSTGKSNLTEGPIGFQSEAAVISFRNIRIKDRAVPSR